MDGTWNGFVLNPGADIPLRIYVVLSYPSLEQKSHIIRKQKNIERQINFFPPPPLFFVCLPIERPHRHDDTHAAPQDRNTQNTAWEDDVRVRPCPVGCGLGDYWLLTDETELTSIVRYVLPHSFSPSICYERETRHVYVQALVNDQGIH